MDSQKASSETGVISPDKKWIIADCFHTEEDLKNILGEIFQRSSGLKCDFSKH